MLNKMIASPYVLELGKPSEGMAGKMVEQIKPLRLSLEAMASRFVIEVKR